MVKNLGVTKLTGRLIVLFLSVLFIIMISYINMYMEISKQILQLSRCKFDNNHQSISRQTPDSISKSNVESKERLREYFQDLNEAVERVEHDFSLASLSSNSTKLVNNPTLGELLHMNITETTTNLDLFHMQITAKEMYPENSAVVENLLIDLATLPLKKVEETKGGTHLKLIFTYQNGMKALFKPKTIDSNQHNSPNLMLYSQYERHNGEIASFHVDRLLGFRRAVPTIGRTINMTSEIMQIGYSGLSGLTFYKSPKPDENTCFIATNCLQYCDRDHPICGQGDQLEGSFMAFIPDHEKAPIIAHEHPYKPSYVVNTKNEWETNPNYCEAVKTNHSMEKSHDMLNFMDTAILDFLIGNQDRHSYYTFSFFENSLHMHFDHGQSFGRPFFDNMLILAPLTQCCVIRSTTLKTLLRYQHSSRSLSAALRESLSKDLLSPVLNEECLEAVDRRVEIVLREIRKCIAKNTINDVIIPK